jgi:hypothetical protein
LNDQQRILPEAGEMRRNHQNNPISIRQVWSFHLALENDELLAEQRIFSQEINPAVEEIGEGAATQVYLGRFDPLDHPPTDTEKEIIASDKGGKDHIGHRCWKWNTFS